jgi:5-(carboxyamino)imidazole ribonucleotide synthase
MIVPGQWLGLLGGGQLGRMFTMAAQSMGYRVAVLDPGNNSPAGSVADRHICADYLDYDSLQKLATLCKGITTEFENVPAEGLRFLAGNCIVSPGADSVAIAQNRIREKQFIESIGLKTAPFAVIQNEKDLTQPLDHLFPGILKVSQFGYDGKGQIRVVDLSETKKAFADLGNKPCVLEKMLQLEKEVSVVVARAENDEMVCYPVAENEHRNGILDISIVPARISPILEEEACRAAMMVARKLHYRGVLCVEFFVLKKEELIVNEIAPRPHNSGHYTIDACMTSQFEQQVRVLAGLPLGNVSLHRPAVMVNLLGEVWQKGEPNWMAVLKHPEVKLHLYGKDEARIGRKMGHVTCLGKTLSEALDVANQVKQLLVRAA